MHSFDLFSMHNVVDGPTRVTLDTKTLIDLIVTTKPNLIKGSKQSRSTGLQLIHHEELAEP